MALEVEGLGTVLRSLPPHTLQVGQASGVNEGQAKLQNHLGVEEPRLQAALNATAFLSMSQAEQRAFLFSAYGLSWTVEEVVEKLHDWLVKERFNPEEARRLAAKAKKYYPSGIAGGPEIFEAMEKRAREERKEHKKAKQQVEAALAELSQSWRAPSMPLDLEEAKGQLAELKARRDEGLKVCGALREIQLRRQTLLEKIPATQEKLTEAQDIAQSLTQELESHPDSVKAETTSNPMETNLQNTLDQAKTVAAASQSKLNTLNQAAQSLACEERRCPLAPDLLPCSLTQAQVKAVLESLQNEHNITSQELALQEASIQDTSHQLKILRTSLEKSRAHSKRILFLQTELNTQHYLIKTLEASLEDLKTEVKNLPEEDPYFLEDLAQLESTLTQRENTLVQYHEAQILSSRQASLQHDLETLTLNLADLEVLVKALGPDGLRKDLLSGILNTFVEQVNNRLGCLTVGTYHLSFSPEMTLLCCANGGPTLPLRLLSKSEQLRVGIALSAVFSQAAGIRFLAIDEADMLDQDNRDLLAEMLLDTADDFDQIVVFTTVGTVPPQNPDLPGVKMFWVEDGSVRGLPIG
nr:hypothetical protein [Desulfitobacterium metallireducens]